MRHISVLLNETIDGLNIKDGDLIIDGTLGDGGHTEEILKRFPNVRVIAFDRDPDRHEPGDGRAKFRRRLHLGR